MQHKQPRTKPRIDERLCSAAHGLLQPLQRRQHNVAAVVAATVAAAAAIAVAVALECVVVGVKRKPARARVSKIIRPVDRRVVVGGAAVVFRRVLCLLQALLYVSALHKGNELAHHVQGSGLLVLKH